MKTILVPVDFSSCSREGLRYAIAFANEFGAKLILLHTTYLGYIYSCEGTAIYDIPALQKAARKAAERKMRDLVRSLDFGAVKFETAFTDGSPVVDICAFAKDHDVDLIITSTHGFTGFTHVLIGSIAEQVVRHAPCSVLVVPSHPRVRAANLAKSAGAKVNRVARQRQSPNVPIGKAVTRKDRRDAPRNEEKSFQRLNVTRRILPQSVPTSPLGFKIERILVPLDFSPASMEALDYAVWLAKQFRAAIHLVHVYPPDEASAMPGAGHLLFESAEAIERLNEELTGIHRKHVPTFRPENCHIRSGRPYEQIVGLAREPDADLIALSTRGHSGLKHLLLGSTAERVVRNAPCPVLVTRKRKQKSKANSKTFAIRTILVPTDFSQYSLAGTEYAAFLAKNLHATLRLFHAMYPYTNYVFVDRAGVRLSGLAEAVEETARQEMNALKQMDFLRGLPVQTELLPGLAVDEICAAAGEPDVDLIVTSTHGRTGLKHALIGSVAEHVVRYAERPVLVVPAVTPNPNGKILCQIL